MILFTDMDETLLDSSASVSLKTREVLRRWCEAGNTLAFSSGRPVDSILEVASGAGVLFPGTYVIANNGAQIYNCDTKTNVRELRIPLSYVRYLQQAADDFGMHLQTYTDHSIITRREDDEICFYRRKIHLPLELADNYADYLPKEPFKLLAIDLQNHDRLEQFRSSLEAWGQDKLQMVFSTEYYLELFVKEAGKGSAVTWLCEHLGIPLEDSYAAGDQANDITMLQAAGCGIAMCNGTDAVKAAADVITQMDNNHDGLALFIENVLEQRR